MTASHTDIHSETIGSTEHSDLTARLSDDACEILLHIQAGRDDTQLITAASAFENHQVRRLFRKLEGLEMVTLEQPEGMVERWVDGQRRVFQAPLQAALTAQGQANVESWHPSSSGAEAMSRVELTEAYLAMCDRVSELEKAIDVFRDQVRRQLE